MLLAAYLRQVASTTRYSALRLSRVLESVDVTMFTEACFSKTNNAEMRLNFCRKMFYFMKHYILFWNQNSKALS